jgi:prepilin peptidase CpaA
MILIPVAIYDIRFQKIPNYITFFAMFAALTYHMFLHGFGGLFFGLAGITLGLFIFIIPYLTGGMGAGDVKLMGAVGGILGPQGVFTAFLFTAIIGGIYALALLGYHCSSGILANCYTAKNTKPFVLSHKKQKPQLCYGVAIALGTFLSVFIKNFI